MTSDKVIMTDPARELAELCETLREEVNPENVRGEEYLAARFGVEVWSPEFFEIIFTISQRINEVSNALNLIELDDDYRSDIKDHIAQILQAFSAQSLRAQWAQSGMTYLSRENVQPLKGISGQIRAVMGYRKVPDADTAGVIEEVELLLEWLTQHQLAESDFIRQGLIEGLRRMTFRLNHLKWVGWGYTLESLRDVISAYTMLERSGIDPNVNPDAGAALKKTGAVIKELYQKIELAKGVTEKADFLLKAYGAASLVYTGTPVVTALLGKG